MKKAFIAIAAVVATGASAFAADLPVKARQAPAPVPYSWTGLYLGINGGGAWAKESWTDNTIPPAVRTSDDFSSRGGVFGGQIGYRWQWNQLVLGVEGTYDWAGLSQTIPSGLLFTEELKVKSLWTATAQIGWAGLDRTLLYVKGGWAGARTAANLVGNGITASHSATSNGWTAGVGLDYAIWQNWTVGIEYDHFDLNYGTFTEPVSNGGTPWIVSDASRLKIDQVVGRLNYQFSIR